MAEDIWYSIDQAMSRNALITMTIGMRGAGKTFAYKRWCILDESHEFVWVRRYESEMKTCVKTFLGDMIAERVITDPDNWHIKGGKLYHNDTVRGHFIALSKQAIQKSGSFPKVDKIVFDEAFLKPHGTHRYLKDEVETFYELYETVNRLRLDGRREVRAVLIGNKTSWLNPWFSYYKVKPFDGRFKWADGKKGLVLVENYTNTAFSDVKRQTRFGRLIDGTAYGDYATDNESWFDSGDTFIAPKPSKYQPTAVVVYKGTEYGLWSDGSGIYIGETFRTNDRRCAGSTDDVAEEVVYNQYLLKSLTSLYEKGQLLFRDSTVKFEMMECLQKYGCMKR